MLSPVCPSSGSARTERLREIWKKTAAVRLAVGAVLLAGTAVAASSGAFAVAGGIAAIRAGIAGTGAFLATDGLLRSCGFEKNVLGISLGVGLAVAAVLAVPGAEAAEIFTERLPVSEVALPPLAAPCEPLTPEAVRSVFADIRADHPGQNCVTLEQSVRRIEGWFRGVPLSESFRLGAAVPDAHSLTCDPSGKVACAMRSLGFLPDAPDPNFGTSFDAATRKLSEADMSRILEKAYGAGDVSEIPSAPAVSDIPVSAPASGVFVELPPADPAVFEKSKIPLFAGIFAALSVPLAVAYSWKKRRTTKLGAPATADDPAPAAIPVAPAPTLSVPTKESAPVSVRADHAYPALRVAVGEVLSGEYGFRAYEPISFGADAGVSRISERAELTLPTPAGEIRATLIESEEKPAFRLIWTESGKDRFSTVRDLEASGDERELQSAVRKALEESYFELAVLREKSKREELRGFHAFEIADPDFSAMYRQLEYPETVAGNRETGGFWFSSGYSVKDGVLPLKNLANPLPEEIDATSVEFAIRGEKWENYVGGNLSKAFRSEFSPGERKLFARALERASTGDDPNPFPHAVDFFNWHKHPGSPL